MTNQVKNEMAGAGEATSICTNRLLYISWAESCSRSDHTARELGGESKMVYLSSLGSHPLTILPKYFGQFLITLWLLIRHRPAAVMVMSPPIFAAIAPWFYCWVTGRPFGLDCHTAAFKHPRFQRFQWLQSALARRAAVNIVHNEHLRDIVQSRGGAAVMVKDVPVLYQSDEVFDLSDGFNVAVACSFNPDEPIAAILEAARKVPDVNFYLTGNPKHLAAELKQNLPANVTLTGFVSDGMYGSLISHSNLVMSLTTRDHTMLRGAWEAIYQGTPVVVSNWQILQDAFNTGALFVDNQADSIADAIRRGRAEEAALRIGAAAGRQEKLNRWQQAKTDLAMRLRLIPPSTATHISG